ncbi:MAG: 50S ribosomal protein L31 [Elusimicrobia bacterium]|jgi:large subunit ribosomal protein L31|nr:MAG: 50S ribosomal protein L31 [Elusimicrobiota bacterium]
MRDGIHPNYQQVTVSCACGSSFVTRSTAKQIRLEICSQCHPFYTGRQKLLDTAGRVERFEKRYASTGGKTVARKPVARKAAAPVKTASKKAEKVLRSTPKPGLKAKTGKGEKPKAAAKAPAKAG